MRILIATENNTMAKRIREVLVRNGLECPPGHTVTLESVADRSGRILPDLVVIVLPPEPAEGLRAIRDTRNTLPSVHILVAGPTDNPKLILDALKEGGDEFLDQDIIEAELTGSMVRSKVREKLGSGRLRSGKLIAVLAASGGSGASTIAAGVSSVLAQEHHECGLVDLRLATGDLAHMFDLRPLHTIADLCEHLSRLDQSLFEQVLVRHTSGVHLLAAPTTLADARRVTGKGVRRALALARVRFPYTVIDVSNTLTAEQMEALWQADIILLVLRLDFTSVRNTRRIIDSLVEMGIARDRLRLVANAYPQRHQLDVEQAETALGMKIAHFIPHDPGSVHMAVNEGQPVVIQTPRSKVSKHIRKLVASVNGAKY